MPIIEIFLMVIRQKEELFLAKGVSNVIKNVTKKKKTKSQEKIANVIQQSRLDKAVEAMIPPESMTYITADLTNKNATLIMNCMIESDVTVEDVDTRTYSLKSKNPHDQLRAVIADNYKSYFNKQYSKNENVEYIHDELVGAGFVERLLAEDPTITDIEWDAKHLRVVSNDEVNMVNGSDIGFDEKAANRLVQRFVIANGTEINQNQPMFNGTYGNMRMSATHKAVSPYGMTFSLRLTRPKLALNEKTWRENNFAPEFVRLWFENIVYARTNIVIAGETGSGKTEFQKYILGFANPRDKFYLIEDVAESHLKELYPDRLINSTLTSSRVTISDQIKQALRNNPEYIIVSETRGQEAFEMLQAALSSHTIVTTVHAKDCRAIPRRFINMCMSGYDVSEEMLTNDIYNYFDIGVHLKAMVYKGKKIRYLSEMVEYYPDGSAVTLFKQVFYNGKFYPLEIGEFSKEIKVRLAEHGKKVLDGDVLRRGLEEKGYVLGLPKELK